MKNKSYIVILLFIIVCCKKKTNSNDNSKTNIFTENIDLINDTSNGTVNAKINGVLWRGFPHVDSLNNFSFTATKYRISGNNYLPNEIFSIFKIKKMSGSQIIFKSDSTLNLTPLIAKTSAFFGTFKPDGDVTCEDFIVIEADSSNNIVQITKQIDNYSEVYGTFKLNLIKINNCSTHHYPDTVKFTNGYFHLKLK